MLESIINSESTAGRKMKTERRSKCFNRKFSHPISPDLTTLSSVLQQLLLWSVVPSLPCCSLEIVKPPFGQQKTVKAYVVTMQLGGTNYEMIWFARYSTMFPAMTCSMWPIWQPRRLIVLSKTLAKRKILSYSVYWWLGWSKLSTRHNLYHSYLPHCWESGTSWTSWDRRQGVEWLMGHFGRAALDGFDCDSQIDVLPRSQAFWRHWWSIVYQKVVCTRMEKPLIT